MKGSYSKLIAFVLSVALVFTTFGSDFANARVFAIEETESVSIFEPTVSTVTEEGSGESESGLPDNFEPTENVSVVLDAQSDGGATDVPAESVKEEVHADGEMEEAQTEGEIQKAQTEGEIEKAQTESEKVEAQSESEAKETQSEDKDTSNESIAESKNTAAFKAKAALGSAEIVSPDASSSLASVDTEANEEITIYAVDEDNITNIIDSVGVKVYYNQEISVSGLIDKFDIDSSKYTFDKKVTVSNDPTSSDVAFSVRKSSREDTGIYYNPNEDFVGDYKPLGSYSLYFWFKAVPVESEDIAPEVLKPSITYVANVPDGATSIGVVPDMEEFDDYYVETKVKFNAPDGKTFISVDGYEFKGWRFEDSTEADFVKGEKEDISLEVPVTLYAVWEKSEAAVEPVIPEKATYTVTFDLAGHGDNFEVKVEEGGKVEEPTIGKVDGYQLKNWWNGSTLWKFNKNVVTENITLTAAWNKVEAGYKVEYFYFDQTLDRYVNKETVTSTETYPIGTELLFKDLNLPSEKTVDGVEYVLDESSIVNDSKNTKNTNGDVYRKIGKSEDGNYFRVYYDTKYTDVAFFILEPDQMVPGPGDEDAGWRDTLIFYPNKSGLSGVSDFTWTGKARKWNGSYLYNKDGIENLESNVVLSYPSSDELTAYLNAKFPGARAEDIVWYWYKKEYDAAIGVTYHIDGYVKATQSTYTIEYYYQQKDGTFKLDKNDTFTDTVTIDPYSGKATVPVYATNDKNFTQKKKKGFINYSFADDYSENLLSDNATRDHSPVLKVYYTRDNLGKQLIINAASAEKEYDGTALEKKAFDPVIPEVFKDGKKVDLDGYTVTAEFDGSIIDVGTTKNKITSITITNDATKESNTYSVKKEGVIVQSEEEQDFDSIIVNFGVLEVTPVKLQVEAKENEKIYGDDDPVLTSVVTKAVKKDDGTTSYEEISATEVSKLTALGLEVNPVREGAGIRKNEYVLWKDKDATAEKDKYDTYPITFKGKKEDTEYKLDNGNYIATYKNSTFTIKARHITLTSGDNLNDGKAYDGKIVTKESVTAPKNSFAFDDEIRFIMDKDAYAILPGEHKKNTFTFLGDEKVLNNYIIDRVYGNLSTGTLNNGEKVKLIVSVDADVDGRDYKEYIYDGQKHDLDVILSVNGQAYKTSRKSEDPDKPSGDPKAVKEFWENLKDWAVIKADAADVSSTGEEITTTITIDGVTFTVSGIFVYGATGVQSGEYDVTLDASNMTVKIDDVDVSKEFDIEFQDKNISGKVGKIGKLVIKPRTVHLTSESASKLYDGTPLTRPDVTVSKAAGYYDFVEGEVTDLRATGYVIEAGQTDVNTIVYNKVSGKYYDRNYIVTTDPGTLSITRADDDVTPPPTDSEVPPVGGNVLGATRQGEVLGATRDTPAVLGARRSSTDDDTSILGRIITILFAAGIGLTMIIIKRKKEEE